MPSEYVDYYPSLPDDPENNAKSVEYFTIPDDPENNAKSVEYLILNKTLFFPVPRGTANSLICSPDTDTPILSYSLHWPLRLAV